MLEEFVLNMGVIEWVAVATIPVMAFIHVLRLPKEVKRPNTESSIERLNKLWRDEIN